MTASKSRNVVICGHFAEGVSIAGSADGQTIKTRIVYDSFVSRYGASHIRTIDTYGWKKSPVKLFFTCIRNAWATDHIVLLCANNGLRVLAPFLYVLSIIYSAKVHYMAIGGWQYDYLLGRKLLTSVMKRFDGMYVETHTSYSRLKSIGFTNLHVVPNFKLLDPLPSRSMATEFSYPLKLCIFSRIMKEKGVEDAVHAVEEVNTRLGSAIFSLDMYGQIDHKYVEHFDELLKNAPDYIQYKGVVEQSNSVATLKDYYLLLFPTLFYTEGVPGTIVDAYAAGLPILSARWESYADILIEGKTAIGYELGNYDELVGRIMDCVDTSKVVMMKQACLDESLKYTSDAAMAPVYQSIECENYQNFSVRRK